MAQPQSHLHINSTDAVLTDPGVGLVTTAYEWHIWGVCEL